MADRHVLKLTPSNRAKALQGIDAAIAIGRKGEPWTMELREAKRSDDQNAALWSLLTQIHRARPIHNNVRMTPELWKCVFMDALGSEATMLPKLDGDGFFPLGHSSSRLTKSEFADLLTLILAWTAKEGIAIEHFDEAARDGAGPNKPASVAA